MMTPDQSRQGDLGQNQDHRSLQGAAWDIPGLSPTQKLVLLAVLDIVENRCRYRDIVDGLFPSEAGLAQLTGFSKRTVITAVQSMHRIEAANAIMRDAMRLQDVVAADLARETATPLDPAKPTGPCHVIPFSRFDEGTMNRADRRRAAKFDRQARVFFPPSHDTPDMWHEIDIIAAKVGVTVTRTDDGSCHATRKADGRALVGVDMPMPSAGSIIELLRTIERNDPQDLYRWMQEHPEEPLTGQEESRLARDASKHCLDCHLGELSNADVDLLVELCARRDPLTPEQLEAIDEIMQRLHSEPTDEQFSSSNRPTLH
jgi:hypothetical protein